MIKEVIELKKVICLLITALLMLSVVTGCGGEHSGSIMKNPDDDTKFPANIADQTSTNTAGGTPLENIAPSAPAIPLNPVEQYDPDRKIYILCGQNEFVIYSSKTFFPAYYFYVFSRIPLKESEIGVSLQIESPFTLDVQEIKLKGTAVEEVNGEMHSADYSAENFSYNLYAVYRGLDFEWAYQLWQEWQAAQTAYEEEEITYNEYEHALNIYMDYVKQYEADYVRLSQDMLPQFYVYQVMIRFNFNTIVDETFTTMDVSINDEVYHEDVGTVQLKTTREFPAELDWYIWDYSVDDGILGYSRGPMPFNDDLHRVPMYFSFKAEGNITLTKLMLENPNREIVQACVHINTIDGFYSEIYWDMTEPIEIYEGDQVWIDIVYREKGMDRMGYTTKLWGYLVYDYEGGTACKISESHLTREYNYYEVYAMVFEGLDLESYYREYYYPVNEQWRVELEN